VSWQDEVDGIEARRRAALALGGEAAVAAQHAKGRLTVRERIDAGRQGFFQNTPTEPLEKDAGTV
jgi:acetyl-CoA carboxylase carboxyltransferase component